MKRGYKVTLMTVAVAMLGLNAMAMAPVITDIPSPIVGGQVDATNPTAFVFGDALNLNDYVSDDTTPDASLKWSYKIPSSPKYVINGIDTLDAAADPTNPASPINASVAARETGDKDGVGNTITIRNTRLAPFTGAGATPGTGLVDEQLVTLYASDGTTYSSKDVWFYTDQSGRSRLSGIDQTPGPKPTPENHWDFNAGAGTWFSESIAGSVTPSATGGQLCIASAGAGNNFAAWNSAWGALTLVDNAVYHIRAKMNFTQASGTTKTPFWDLVINNYAYDGSAGQNLFGGDFYFLENEGKANAISTSGGSTFDVWWCPTPFQTAAWKSQVFSTHTDNDRKARMMFRVLDVTNVPAYDQAGGTVCLDDLLVERYDFAALTASKTAVWSANSFANGTTASAQVFIDTATSVNFAGGTIALTPGNTSGANNGRNKEYVLVGPGSAINPDYGNATQLAGMYPCAWEDKTLYMIQMDLSAPDANSAAHPWDVFWIAMDTPTNEIIAESYTTAYWEQAGMPKTGAAQSFYSFYYGNNLSATTLNNGKRLRPRLAVANDPALVAGGLANDGTMKLHSIAISKVAVPQ